MLAARLNQLFWRVLAWSCGPCLSLPIDFAGRGPVRTGLENSRAAPPRFGVPTRSCRTNVNEIRVQDGGDCRICICGHSGSRHRSSAVLVMDLESVVVERGLYERGRRSLCLYRSCIIIIMQGFDKTIGGQWSVVVPGISRRILARDRLGGAGHGDMRTESHPVKPAALPVAVVVILVVVVVGVVVVVSGGGSPI